MTKTNPYHLRRRAANEGFVTVTAMIAHYRKLAVMAVGAKRQRGVKKEVARLLECSPQALDFYGWIAESKGE